MKNSGGVSTMRVEENCSYHGKQFQNPPRRNNSMEGISGEGMSLHWLSILEDAALAARSCQSLCDARHEESFAFSRSSSARSSLARFFCIGKKKKSKSRSKTKPEDSKRKFPIYIGSGNPSAASLLERSRRRARSPGSRSMDDDRFDTWPRQRIMEDYSQAKKQLIAHKGHTIQNYRSSMSGWGDSGVMDQSSDAGTSFGDDGLLTSSNVGSSRTRQDYYAFCHQQQEMSKLDHDEKLAVPAGKSIRQLTTTAASESSPVPKKKRHKDLNGLSDESGYDHSHDVRKRKIRESPSTSEEARQGSANSSQTSLNSKHNLNKKSSRSRDSKNTIQPLGDANVVKHHSEKLNTKFISSSKPVNQFEPEINELSNSSARNKPQQSSGSLVMRSKDFGEYYLNEEDGRMKPRKTSRHSTQSDDSSLEISSNFTADSCSISISSASSEHRVQTSEDSNRRIDLPFIDSQLSTKRISTINTILEESSATNVSSNSDSSATPTGEKKTKKDNKTSSSNKSGGIDTKRRYSADVDGPNGSDKPTSTADLAYTFREEIDNLKKLEIENHGCLEYHGPGIAVMLPAYKEQSMEMDEPFETESQKIFVFGNKQTFSSTLPNFLRNYKTEPTSKILSRTFRWQTPAIYKSRKISGSSVTFENITYNYGKPPKSAVKRCLLTIVWSFAKTEIREDTESVVRVARLHLEYDLDEEMQGSYKPVIHERKEGAKVTKWLEEKEDVGWKDGKAVIKEFALDNKDAPNFSDTGMIMETVRQVCDSLERVHLDTRDPSLDSDEQLTLKESSQRDRDEVTMITTLQGKDDYLFKDDDATRFNWMNKSHPVDKNLKLDKTLQDKIVAEDETSHSPKKTNTSTNEDVEQIGVNSTPVKVHPDSSDLNSVKNSSDNENLTTRVDVDEDNVFNDQASGRESQLASEITLPGNKNPFADVSTEVVKEPKETSDVDTNEATSSLDHSIEKDFDFGERPFATSSPKNDDCFDEYDLLPHRRVLRLNHNLSENQQSFRPESLPPVKNTNLLREDNKISKDSKFLGNKKSPSLPDVSDHQPASETEDEHYFSPLDQSFYLGSREEVCSLKVCDSSSMEWFSCEQEETEKQRSEEVQGHDIQDHETIPDQTMKHISTSQGNEFESKPKKLGNLVDGLEDSEIKKIVVIDDGSESETDTLVKGSSEDEDNKIEIQQDILRKDENSNEVLSITDLEDDEISFEASDKQFDQIQICPKVIDFTTSLEPYNVETSKLDESLELHIRNEIKKRYQDDDIIISPTEEILNSDENSTPSIDELENTEELKIEENLSEYSDEQSQRNEFDENINDAGSLNRVQNPERNIGDVVDGSIKDVTWDDVMTESPLIINNADDDNDFLDHKEIHILKDLKSDSVHSASDHDRSIGIDSSMIEAAPRLIEIETSGHPASNVTFESLEQSNEVTHDIEVISPSKVMVAPDDSMVHDDDDDDDDDDEDGDEDDDDNESYDEGVDGDIVSVGNSFGEQDLNKQISLFDSEAEEGFENIYEEMQKGDLSNQMFVNESIRNRESGERDEACLEESEELNKTKELISEKMISQDGNIEIHEEAGDGDEDNDGGDDDDDVNGGGDNNDECRIDDNFDIIDNVNNDPCVDKGYINIHDDEIQELNVEGNIPGSNISKDSSDECGEEYDIEDDIENYFRQYGNASQDDSRSIPDLMDTQSDELHIRTNFQLEDEKLDESDDITCGEQDGSDKNREYGFDLEETQLNQDKNESKSDTSSTTSEESRIFSGFRKLFVDFFKIDKPNNKENTSKQPSEELVSDGEKPSSESENKFKSESAKVPGAASTSGADSIKSSTYFNSESEEEKHDGSKSDEDINSQFSNSSQFAKSTFYEFHMNHRPRRLDSGYDMKIVKTAHDDSDNIVVQVFARNDVILKEIENQLRKEIEEDEDEDGWPLDGKEKEWTPEAETRKCPIQHTGTGRTSRSSTNNTSNKPGQPAREGFLSPTGRRDPNGRSRSPSGSPNRRNPSADKRRARNRLLAQAEVSPPMETMEENFGFLPNRVTVQITPSKNDQITATLNTVENFYRLIGQELTPEKLAQLSSLQTGTDQASTSFHASSFVANHAQMRDQLERAFRTSESMGSDGSSVDRDERGQEDRQHVFDGKWVPVYDCTDKDGNIIKLPGMATAEWMTLTDGRGQYSTAGGGRIFARKRRDKNMPGTDEAASDAGSAEENFIDQSGPETEHLTLTSTRENRMRLIYFLDKTEEASAAATKLVSDVISSPDTEGSMDGLNEEEPGLTDQIMLIFSSSDLAAGAFGGIGGDPVPEPWDESMPVLSKNYQSDGEDVAGVIENNENGTRTPELWTTVDAGMKKDTKSTREQDRRTEFGEKRWYSDEGHTIYIRPSRDELKRRHKSIEDGIASFDAKISNLNNRISKLRRPPNGNDTTDSSHSAWSQFGDNSSLSQSAADGTTVNQSHMSATQQQTFFHETTMTEKSAEGNIVDIASSPRGDRRLKSTTQGGFSSAIVTPGPTLISSSTSVDVGGDGFSKDFDPIITAHEYAEMISVFKYCSVRIRKAFDARRPVKWTDDRPPIMILPPRWVWGGPFADISQSLPAANAHSSIVHLSEQLDYSPVAVAIVSDNFYVVATSNILYSQPGTIAVSVSRRHKSRRKRRPDVVGDDDSAEAENGD